MGGLVLPDLKQNKISHCRAKFSPSDLNLTWTHNTNKDNKLSGSGKKGNLRVSIRWQLTSIAAALEMKI